MASGIITWIDADTGSEIGEAYGEVPGEGHIVTLDHPLLGGRCDYVVAAPPRWWYADNFQRRGAKVTLTPTKITVRVREQTATTDT